MSQALWKFLKRLEVSKDPTMKHLADYVREGERAKVFGSFSNLDIPGESMISFSPVARMAEEKAKMASDLGSVLAQQQMVKNWDQSKLPPGGYMAMFEKIRQLGQLPKRQETGNIPFSEYPDWLQEQERFRKLFD